ncbi:MAG: YidC/Oxa1 family insertase periplasmic-domain containing protein [Pirellulaceae bacterium]
MERRFVLFLVLTLLLWTGYIGLQFVFAPDPPAVVQNDAAKEGAKAPAEAAPEEAEPPAEEADKKPADQPEQADGAGVPPDTDPPQRVSLGSADKTGIAKMLVTFNSRGAAVERVELNRYSDVENQGGYLGHLALSVAQPAGVQVNFVGPGTPAALATSENPAAGVGLKPGDVIVAIDKQTIATPTQVERYLSTKTLPGERAAITVQRAGLSQPVVFIAKLTRHLLDVVRPEDHVYETAEGKLQNLPSDPLSLLLTLDSIGAKSVRPGASEIAGLPSLFKRNWEIDATGDDFVQFSYTLDEAAMKAIDKTGSLKIVKHYELAKSEKPGVPDYHLKLRVEIHNLGEEEQSLSYRLQGPTGLPLEGWWYSTKLHPDWVAGAGARDVAWKVQGKQHHLIGGPKITSEAKAAIEEGEPPGFNLLTGDESAALVYAGIDTQFFASAILPQPIAENQPIKFRRVLALPVQEVTAVPKNRLRTMNVSVLLVSEISKVKPGDKLAHEYQVFFGPKDPQVLELYGLDAFIEYGWTIFKYPAIWLQHVLGFFYSITGNYGIAIILLTVLVRSCMVPVSLKQARSAAMMQHLAPEVQKIKEKHPDEPMKQHAAVQELYKKYNFNPFGGCLLVFIQLPIFIGLYRCLSVDIDLRDASLIPGIAWASNLAGPDKLFRWDGWMPAFVAEDAAGWLGPFFNVLPLVTVALFLVQQKMFTPPATDEQTRMQQQMMTYMTVFMGVMFYKVPAGLCLYFITSSLWGICERKMLAKPKPPGDAKVEALPAKPASPNGSAKAAAAKAAAAKKQKRR